MEAAGGDYNTSLIEQGMAWIYVHFGDYAAAKKLLPPPEDKSETPPSEPSAEGEKKVIAFLEASQTGPVLERLKAAGIPVEIRNPADESGLEMRELLVEASYYNRGCDVVEAWSEEVVPVKKKKLVCPECGSENCSSTPHIKLGWTVQCKDCGFEFLS